MSTFKLALFIIYSVFLAGGVYSLADYIRADPGVPVITDKTQVESNRIEKDPAVMPVEEVQADLQCFYTLSPELDIKYVEGDEYLLTAGLCERKWQKTVKIESRSRDSPRNIIMGGPFIDSDFNRGAWAQYFRLYGRVGFGGGVLLCRDYAVVQGGIAWMW